jgi:hypothetical protein
MTGPHRSLCCSLGRRGAIAGGASVTAMKNSHGVLIEMVATHVGLNLSLGPKGVTISLEK